MTHQFAFALRYLFIVEALIVVGCHHSASTSLKEDFSTSQAVPIMVTYDQSGPISQSVNATKNSKLIVKLRENGGTPYHWNESHPEDSVSLDDQVIEQAS